jgi:hypothetical protein
MSNKLIWIRVFPEEAVKGKIYLGHLIVAIGRETKFYPYQSQCKTFPFRLLPPGTYRDIGLKAND